MADWPAASDKKPYDGILKHRDATPNIEGLRQVFVENGLEKAWGRRPEPSGDRDLVIMVGIEGPGVPGWDVSVFSKGDLVVHATNHLELFERAAWLLPNTSSFEKSGTVVNALGMAQKLSAVLPKRFGARDGSWLAFGIVSGQDA
jgi:NADH dehydrogenase/NADH:ubiquinone oxidoreductase subunit G